jgi:SM-20-related protein
MEAKFEELVEGFITGKVGISEAFLTEKLSASLSANLMNLRGDGRMATAGIGNAHTKTETLSIRTDRTSWLDANTKNHAEMEFLEIMERFIEYLNRTCYTGLNACEFHYALYEEGTFYGRHKDQFRNNNNRKFSMISYLNDNWIEGNGGQLIIHHDDKAAQSILPSNCKTVFFQSDMLEHEVAKANRPRMSVTGWLKRV